MPQHGTPRATTDGAPGQSTDRFDLVILGGGSGGYACAFRAAQLGKRVVLVEKDRLGGTCLHRGCIPTKALLHAAEVAETARHGAALGVNSSVESIDMTKVNAYKDGVVGRLFKGLQGLAGSHGVELVSGTGRLVDGHTVAVELTDGGTRTLTGEHVVLATGSRPRLVPGLEIGGRIMTSDEALRLDEVPARTLVLGGGVIGVEFASALASLGSEVTILEALPRLVPSEDEAVSKTLERAFRKRGITARTGSRLSSASQSGEVVTVTLEDGSSIECDVLLVAVGRGPVAEGLGYEEAGVTVEQGFVVTDERLRTSVDSVRAVGDVVRGLQLAHRGFAHGVFVAEDLARLDPAPVEDRHIPRVTYSDPEIGSVGLTERQARDAGLDVETYEYNLGGNGRSQILGTQGFVKLVREKDGPVIGIHMVGARMGEQIGEAQLIVGWEAHPDEVASLVHAHPTQNEALGEAHLALAGKPLHAHG